MADETADQIRQAMDQMKAHYDTELRQALASIRDLEARLAEVEALRVAADRVGLRYVSVTMLSDALRSGEGDRG